MKINNYSNKKWMTALALTALMTGSCKKLIEIPPNPPSEIVTAQQFGDSATAMFAVAGIYNYAAAQGGFTFNNGYLVECTGLSSDELAYTRSDVGLYQFFANNISPLTNSEVASLWSQPYTGLYPVNAVITGVAVSTGLSASFNQQITAEMKVVRALYFIAETEFLGKRSTHSPINGGRIDQLHLTGLHIKISRNNMYARSNKEFHGLKLFIASSHPVPFRAGSLSFFKKSPFSNGLASHIDSASSGTISTGICHDDDVSLYARFDAEE